MKTQIANLLGLSQDDYEGIIFNTYNHWCAKFSRSTHEYQSHLNNQKIFNWFQAQFKIYEKEFLLDVQGFNLESKENYKYYRKTINSIHKHWPQALGVKPPTSFKLLINVKLN